MDDEPVTVSRKEWDAVLRRLAVLEARASADPPRPDPDATGGVAPSAPAGVAEAEGGAAGWVSRRSALLGLAGAGAGLVAASAVAAPAAAATGDPLILGNSSNTATSSTVHTVTGSGVFYGLAAVDNSTPPGATNTAVLGSANGQAFNTAVRGVATSNATAVRATAVNGPAVDASSTGTVAVTATGSTYGVFATGTGATGIGLAAYGGDSGYGVVAVGRDALRLSASVVAAPPNRVGASSAGAVAVDGNRDLWYCTTSGTPGVWRKLSGATTAGSLHLLPAPVRVYDSRAGTKPAVGSKTPFAPGTTRSFDLKVNNSTVPAGAVGALVTILLVNAANVNGNLTIWANGVARPASNTMVWGGNAGRFTATAVTALDAQARCLVNSSAKTDLVLDVVGYYR